MSFAKSWQEKGCSSQAETWQVKNILMKDCLTGKVWRFRSFHERLNTTLKFHFSSLKIKLAYQIFL